MVKTVWLLRHAKSSRDDPSLDDHDRPLARRGRKAAERLCRWSSANRVLPELVLCSTALRARSTLDLVLGGLGNPQVAIESCLYHATAWDLLDRLHTVPEGVTEVLLVGHNPGLHDLVGMLAPPGTGEFPTGALAKLRLAIDAWPAARPSCAQLDQIVLPRLLPR